MMSCLTWGFTWSSVHRRLNTGEMRNLPAATERSDLTRWVFKWFYLKPHDEKAWDDNFHSASLPALSVKLETCVSRQSHLALVVVIPPQDWFPSLNIECSISEITVSISKYYFIDSGNWQGRNFQIIIQNSVKHVNRGSIGQSFRGISCWSIKKLCSAVQWSVWYCCCCDPIALCIGQVQLSCYSGAVITLSESRVKFKSPELPSLPPHVVPGLTDPETHVGGLRRREILGFKLFSLDISHKPWQTILRRYLNWIAPWEEKIVSWQYNSSKVSPQTNWKVLQEPKNTDIEHTKHICWSWRQNSSSFWPA